MSVRDVISAAETNIHNDSHLKQNSSFNELYSEIAIQTMHSLLDLKNCSCVTTNNTAFSSSNKMR